MEDTKQTKYQPHAGNAFIADIISRLQSLIKYEASIGGGFKLINYE